MFISPSIPNSEEAVITSSMSEKWLGFVCIRVTPIILVAISAEKTDLIDIQIKYFTP